MQVRRYAAELVAVLSHLHDNGVVYVDLKPENVLLQDCGHIMLCDMDLVHTQTEIEHIRELESGVYGFGVCVIAVAVAGWVGINNPSHSSGTHPANLLSRSQPSPWSP